MADLSVTAGNVLASTGGAATIRSTYKAGATITAGQAVYLGGANTWLLIDQDAAATGNELTTEHGIALNGASSGQPVNVCTYDTAFTPGCTMTVGVAMYASDTAGGIGHDVPGSASYPVFLGIPKTTTVMFLNPVASGTIIT
jgi:hypothetical protein